MGRTTIPGNRISNGSIENRHLHPSFKISEENIEFKFEPHEHKNKSVLDIIKNSIPQTLTTIDLKDILYTILEVGDARDVNKTLRQTLEGKASVQEIETLAGEINDARRGYSSLNEFLIQFQADIDQILANHMGAVSHQDLDSMHAEVKAARGIYLSLKDRLDDLSMKGVGSGGGSITIDTLTPWNMEFVLRKGLTIVDLTNSYTPGNTTLQVFEGPMLLQAGVDYTEVTPTRIEFIEAFEEDVNIRIVGVNTGRLFEWERRISGNGSMSRIELLDSYRPGERELLVYEDGLLLREVEDYEETAPHVITFKEPIPTGSLVTIYKRRN